MGSAVHYPPRKYRHVVGHEELFIDHPAKKRSWGKFRAWYRQNAELLAARWKIVIDKRFHVSHHTALIRNHLREVGLNRFDLLKPETFTIAKILHKDETILGAIVGHVDNGGSALIAITNLRVIYLDQIPLFSKMDEINQATIAGVSSNGNRWGNEVILYTSMGSFRLQGVNTTAATIFVKAVERSAIDLQTVGAR
ncbi:MAG TPA: PH domain-containing protein [Dongiaceae bacterium]|nr:PH domain-containing protein [Dongiaceae bacterium]